MMIFQQMFFQWTRQISLSILQIIWISINSNMHFWVYHLSILSFEDYSKIMFVFLTTKFIVSLFILFVFFRLQLWFFTFKFLLISFFELILQLFWLQGIFYFLKFAFVAPSIEYTNKLFLHYLLIFAFLLILLTVFAFVKQPLDLF